MRFKLDPLAPNGISSATDQSTIITGAGSSDLSGYQPLDSELTALASTTSAANKLPYFTGSGTATVTDLTAAGRALLDDANAAAQIATLGLDPDISTLSLPASTAISTFGATLVDDADAATARSTLGAGTGNGDMLLGTAQTNTAAKTFNAGTFLDKGSQVFDVRTYGAVADGLNLTDGNMTSASAILTSATATFTSADVGKAIAVEGASSSSGTKFILASTILSYQSATQVTLANDATATTTTGNVWYGTDSGVAYNAALDAAALVKGTVFFPPGTFVLRTSIAKEYSNITVEGSGIGKTTLVAANAIWMTNISGNQVAASIYNLEIKGLTYDMNYLSSGISVANVQGLLIEDVEIKNSYQHYMIFAGQFGVTDPSLFWARNSVFRRLKLTNNVGSTVESINLSSAKNVTFEDCYFGDSLFYNLFSWYAQDLKMSDCFFQNTPGMSIVGIGPSTLNNIQFEDASLILTAPKNVTINGGSFGNTVTDNSRKSRILFGGDFYAIGGEQAYYSTYGPNLAENIVINGVNFTQAFTSPIECASTYTYLGTKYMVANDITIIGCKFDRCGWPLDVSARYLNIIGNTFANAVQFPTTNASGFLGGGEHVTFVGNKTYDNQVVDEAASAITATLDATAGNLNGAYIYRVTYVNPQGETAGSVSSNTVTTSNQRINLSAVPISPDATVTARRIYRTAGGGAEGTQKLLATIADNTTTTYADNIADGSLGVVIPLLNTAKVPTQTYGAIFRNKLEEDGIVSSMTLVLDDNDLQGGVRYNDTGVLTVAPTSNMIVMGDNNTGYNPNNYYSQGNVTGSITFDRINGRVIGATLTGNISPVVTSAKTPGDTLMLVLTQDGTGSRTVTWPANVKNGPVLQTAASAIDLVTFISDGTNWNAIASSTAGPASSTDNAIARWDGTSGKLLQNSTATLGDTGAIATTLADTTNVIGLTVTQNDVTNNPKAVSIVNAGTASAVLIDQNGNTATAATSSVGGALQIENTGNTGLGLSVYTNQASPASGAGLVQFLSDNATFNQEVLYIQQDGTGSALFVDNNNTASSGSSIEIDDESTSGSGAALNVRSPRGGQNVLFTQEATTTSGKNLVLNTDSTGLSLDVDADATNRSWSLGAVSIIATSNVTDAATYTKSGSIFNITSNVVESSGTITDTAVVLNVENTHADASGNLATLNMDGTGKALFVDHDDTGTNPSVDIDRDGNNAASISGLRIDTDNAGAGGAIGLEVLGVSATGGVTTGVKIGLPSGGASNYALNLADTTGVVGGGITFGTDTNLYRSAANVLTTDDSLTVAINLTVTGTTLHSDNVTIADAKNIVLNATTGTKIGTATTQKLAFYNSTPVVQPSAYTQTYSTADKTHANPTSATLTDNTAGTANTTLELMAGAVYATDVVAIRNNFADLAASNNAIIVDLLDLKQLVNSLIDDMQALGLAA